MRTKLIKPPPKDNGQYRHVEAKVALQQAESALYTNKEKRAKPTAFGSNQNLKKKQTTFTCWKSYSNPHQQSTRLTILSTEKKWNVARLSLCSNETPRAEKHTSQNNYQNELFCNGKDFY